MAEQSLSSFMVGPQYPQPLLDRIHECCHAVVAWHLRLPGPDYFKFEPHPMVMQVFPDDTSPEHKIMTFMAGIVHFEIFNPPSLGIRRKPMPQQEGEEERESDTEVVRQLLCRFHSTERDAVKDRLMKKTRAIIVQRAGIIVELASTMLGKAVVDGAEAKRIYAQLDWLAKKNKRRK